MNTLANDLLSLANKGGAKIEVKSPGAPRNRKFVWTSKHQMESYEANSDKPCTKPNCNKPRHKSKSGRCHTSLCDEHFRNYRVKLRNGA